MQVTERGSGSFVSPKAVPRRIVTDQTRLCGLKSSGALYTPRVSYVVIYVTPGTRWFSYAYARPLGQATASPQVEIAAIF